jgi:hypothetical protein
LATQASKQAPWGGFEDEDDDEYEDGLLVAASLAL